MSDSVDILNALALMTNFVILPALSYGSQLALGALAVTLVYSVLRFSNFAQADSMSFGTMIVILLSSYLISKGWIISGIPTALLVIPFAVIGMFAYLIAMDRLVYQHYRKIKAKLHLFFTFFKKLKLEKLCVHTLIIRSWHFYQVLIQIKWFK